MERLSNLDVRGIIGPNNRIGGFMRREDMMSMNNMSIDMMNMGQRREADGESQHQGDDQMSADMSADFSAPGGRDHIHNGRHRHQPEGANNG